MRGEIGKRAAEAIRARVHANDINYEDEMKRLNISRQLLYSWSHGQCDPNGRTLQTLAFAGYDVHYFLTGERK